MELSSIFMIAAFTQVNLMYWMSSSFFDLISEDRTTTQVYVSNYVLSDVTQIRLTVAVPPHMKGRKETSRQCTTAETATISVTNSLIIIPTTKFLFLTFCLILKLKGKPKTGLNRKEVNFEKSSRERKIKFDAFVPYHSDTDHGFVVDTLLPELEKSRGFNLCIHSRDFEPGQNINDNIEEAIEGSNSAIIVMSQGFVDSKWCKEEFTHCYIENMKDAAFNLFVIMMQPADTLVNLSNDMKTFIETKTYLDVNDPELFTKLSVNLQNNDGVDVKQNEFLDLKHVSRLQPTQEPSSVKNAEELLLDSCGQSVQFKGNSTIICVHIEQWALPRHCYFSRFGTKHSNVFSLLSLSETALITQLFTCLLFPILVIILFLIAVVRYKYKSKRAKTHSLKSQKAGLTKPAGEPPTCKTTKSDILPSRNRSFDAVIFYHFDTDDDFFINKLLPELEETRGFKLIHSRNFIPGRDIIDNIEEAIEGSNSAIIVMSQGFVDSMWCKEEFTHCYIENMKDAAFNLFIIMMQPADKLENLSDEMEIFISNKTYLQVNDKILFAKLANMLDEQKRVRK